MEPDDIITDMPKSYNIVKEIDDFRKINNISLNYISVRSGISVTNLNRLFSGGPDISMLMLVRIVGALWDKGIADALFKRNVRKCISQTVNQREICTATDYAALILLLWDYFHYGNEHEAEDNLKMIYRSLEGEIALVNSLNEKTDDELGPDTHFYPYIEFFTKGEHTKLYEYKVDKRVLDVHLKSYFESNFFVPTFLSDFDPAYSIGTDDYRPLMKSGETMVWSDISNLLTLYRKENDMTISDLKNGSVAHRMENKKNHAYKYSDVMAIDDELEMGGAFFSVCFNATRNSVLLSKLCSMMDPDVGLFQKKDDQEKYELGIHSFFAMLRYLESCVNSNNGPYKVLNVLRAACFYKEPKYHYDYLKKAVSEFPELFPENPLKYYGILPE